MAITDFIKLEKRAQRRFALKIMNKQEREDAKYNQQIHDREYHPCANGTIKHHHKKWYLTGRFVRQMLYVPLAMHGSSRNVNVYINAEDRLQREVKVEDNERARMDGDYMDNAKKNALSARAYLEQRAKCTQEIGENGRKMPA